MVLEFIACDFSYKSVTVLSNLFGKPDFRVLGKVEWHGAKGVTAYSPWLCYTERVWFKCGLIQLAFLLFFLISEVSVVCTSDGQIREPVTVGSRLEPNNLTRGEWDLSWHFHFSKTFWCPYPSQSKWGTRSTLVHNVDACQNHPEGLKSCRYSALISLLRWF